MAGVLVNIKEYLIKRTHHVYDSVLYDLNYGIMLVKRIMLPMNVYHPISHSPYFISTVRYYGDLKFLKYEKSYLSHVICTVH